MRECSRSTTTYAASGRIDRHNIFGTHSIHTTEPPVRTKRTERIDFFRFWFQTTSWLRKRDLDCSKVHSELRRSDSGALAFIHRTGGHHFAARDDDQRDASCTACTVEKRNASILHTDGLAAGRATVPMCLRWMWSVGRLIAWLCVIVAQWCPKAVGSFFFTIFILHFFQFLWAHSSGL